MTITMECKERRTDLQGSPTNLRKSTGEDRISTVIEVIKEMERGSTSEDK